MRKAWLLFPILFSASGCEFLWNVSNRGALQKDVAELFARQGVTVSEMDCNMLDLSRSAACTFKEVPAQVAALLQRFDLREVVNAEQGSSAEFYHCRQVLEEVKKAGRMPASFSDMSHVRVYGIVGRPPSLKLKNGGQFEFLILFQQTETNDVLAAVSYAYG